MRAILLAAGVGKRMGAKAYPKCLLTFAGRSLLQMTLENLRAVGIEEVILVVGYRKEEIIAEARRHAKGMRVHFITNPRYQEGAILSLWAAREHLEGPVLVMDSDVLAPSLFFERLVRSVNPSCLLVDGSVADSGEEQMVFGRQGRVLFITKRPSPELRSSMELFGESIGFLKLSKEGPQVLRRLLEEKVSSGVVNIEHEQVYPQLFEAVEVGLERVDGIPWTEIDTPEDLKRARKILSQWEAPSCFNRAISAFFLPWIAKLPVSPNQWTSLSLLVGLGSLFFMSQGTRLSDLLAAFLFQLFYMVDNWDGAVARLKGLSSRWGGWFDMVVDGIVQCALPVALAAGLTADQGFSQAMVWGGIASVGVLLDFVITGWAKVRGFGPSIFGDSSIGKNSRGEGASTRRWIRVNLTNENFSLVMVTAFLLSLKGPFLVLMAIGTQIFWVSFLARQWRRLLPQR